MFYAFCWNYIFFSLLVFHKVMENNSRCFMLKLHTFVTVLSFEVNTEHTDCTVSRGTRLIYRVFQEEHFSLNFVEQSY